MPTASSIRSTVVLATAIFAAVSADAQPAAVDQVPRTTALAVTAPIRLDGNLDEPAWAAASSIGPLVQREPIEGASASVPTEVHVLYDADTLYVGIVCRERHDEIVSTQLGRDADLSVDDLVTIVVDPFFDHRNGFFFQINPAGARTDGQISNNSESLNRDWDGIWDAAARVTADGWQAEIAIPFKTLRFKPGQTTWGFNVERQLKRRNEIDRWATPRLNVWIGNLADAGLLEGLTGIRQGLGLDIRPYGSGATETGENDSTAGLDVFDNLTPNLNAALTVNTDFAETEADIRQINLTRFPLFFPEKRTFFLEGAGVFDVAGLAGSGDLRPFFSRTIGLVQSPTGEDNVTVPILAGTKITGRQADYNIGLLEVATRGVPSLGLGPQDMTVLRVSRNLFEQSWIGGIVTSGDPTGTGGNTLGGVDARFATSRFRGDKNLAFETFALATNNEATRKRDGAVGFRVDYPNDRWDVNLNWKQIGDNFDAALGFVPRTGIRKTDLGIAFQPRPERWGVRQFAFEFRPTYITNLHDRVEDWSIFIAPFNLRADSGDHVEINYIPAMEHLDAPFEINPGVVLPIGSYRWNQFRVLGNTATKRVVVGTAEVWWGTFYDGTRREVSLALTLKPSKYLSATVTSDRNDIRLVEGSFTTVVYTGRLDWNFSPNVSWANLVQYDSDSRIAGVQSRFRWILTPGTDLFLVLNRGWYRTFEPTYVPSFDRESVKFQYTFRL